MKISRIWTKRKRSQEEHSIVEDVFKKLQLTYMLNTLTWAIGALVDGAIIGNFLGVDSVASYGLVWPVMFVYALIGSIISGGSRNLYTQLAGHGKTDEANNVFTLACLMSLILSVCVVVLTLLFISPLAGLLGASGKNELLRPLVCQYLSGFILGLPFDNGAKILSGYMGMDSDHRRVMAATIAMTITDIVGDLIAVFVFHGGMFMMGFTTAFGNAVYFAVLSTHFLRKKRMLRFRLKGLSGIKEKIITILVNGAPTGITRISNAFCGIAVNRILSSAAASSFIAAYSVHKSMGSLMGATYLSVADTVWTLSSVYYGEEDKNALDELQKSAFIHGMNLTIFVAVILVAHPQIFASIYIGRNNPETLALASQSVRLFAVCLPMYFVAYMFDDYLMGTGKLKQANIYSFFLECGAVVPVVWLMIRQFGGAGAWFATPITLLIMVAGAVIYIVRWSDEKINSRRLLIARDFGTSAGEEISISADSMLEIVGMSRIAKLFCMENGIDKKKTNALSLCIEELGTNILEHGFSDGKPHSIDLRILAKDGEIILRIRDDCRPFNLVERYEMSQADEEDITKNLGIRMVMRMSTDVQYLSIMGTNNLIIRI